MRVMHTLTACGAVFCCAVSFAMGNDLGAVGWCIATLYAVCESTRPYEE